MKNLLFMVRDNVDHAMIEPIISVRHQAAAVRIFTDALNSPKSVFYNHPKDYDLVYLGEQNTETGEILALERPKLILGGNQWALSREVAGDSPSVGNNPDAGLATRDIRPTPSSLSADDYNHNINHSER